MLKSIKKNNFKILIILVFIVSFSIKKYNEYKNIKLISSLGTSINLKNKLQDYENQNGLIKNSHDFYEAINSHTEYDTKFLNNKNYFIDVRYSEINIYIYKPFMINIFLNEDEYYKNGNYLLLNTIPIKQFDSNLIPQLDKKNRKALFKKINDLIIIKYDEFLDNENTCIELTGRTKVYFILNNNTKVYNYKILNNSNIIYKYFVSQIELFIRNILLEYNIEYIELDFQFPLCDKFCI